MKETQSRICNQPTETCRSVIRCSSIRPAHPFIRSFVYSLICLLYLSGFLRAETPPAPVDLPPEPTDASLSDISEELVSIEEIDLNTPPPEGQVIGTADEVTWNDQIAQLHGSAVLRYEDIVLIADTIWADMDGKMIRAQGSVHLRVGNEETYADQLIYNLETRQGIVREGIAYTEPWYYQGSEVLKVDDDESLIKGGSLTTCSLKYPHFYFSASRIVIHVDKEMVAKHVVLKVGGVPLLYLPVYRRDLRKAKRARIVVRLGTDSYQGHFMNIVLPLIRRPRFKSELLYDYTSRRGSGVGNETRYNVRDVRFKEIRFNIPEDATATQKREIQQRAQEMLRRLKGEYNKIYLQRIFLKYPLQEDDIQRARQRAEEVHALTVAEGADFAELARTHSDDNQTKYQGGELGLIMKGEGKLDPAVEEIAFRLSPGEISPIIETDKGYVIVTVDQVLDEYGVHEIALRQILFAVQPSDETKQVIQDQADQLLSQLKDGSDFADLANQYTDEPGIQDGDVGWIGINELPSSQRYALRRLEPGNLSNVLRSEEGVYICKILDKEPTPTFEEIAREFSEGETADQGGDVGYRGPWEDPPEVAREAQRLDTGEVSRVIGTESDYRIIKVEQKRTYGGRLNMYRGDLFSFSRENPSDIGDQWDISYQHRHLFYTPWDNRQASRNGLTMVNRFSFVDRRYAEGAFGTPRSDLRLFTLFSWGSAVSAQEDSDRIIQVRIEGDLYEITAAQFAALEDSGEKYELVSGARPQLTFDANIFSTLTVDKSFDLLGDEGSFSTQKLPELDIRWSGMRVNRLPFLKQIDKTLQKAATAIHTDSFPLLAVPTLEHMRLDIDTKIGNYLRDRYAEEENIYLQSMSTGLDLQKQGTMVVLPNREINLDLRGIGQLVWHSKNMDQERNIWKFVFRTNSSISNRLFRVYNASFIPGISRVRHQMDTIVRFDFTPPVAREDRLYPFGPTAYYVDQKRLSMNFTTKLDVKPKRAGRRGYTLLNFDTRGARDFTQQDYLNRREYDHILSRLTITPFADRRVQMTFTSRHDPNLRDGERFKQIGFSSSVRYNHPDRIWGISVGNQFHKLTRTASRRLTFGVDWRPNRLFQVDLNFIYDWSQESWYSQTVTIRRNLHDWDLRISWRRIGIQNTRKDFTFQINLIADPSATIGVGYDAVTDSWGVRSLPVGVPYGGFGTGRLGRSYF